MQQASTDLIRSLTNLALGAGLALDEKSFSEFGRLTEIRPFQVVSDEAARVEYMTDISHLMVTLTTAYMSRAVNAITKISNVEVRKILAAVATDNNALDVFTAKAMASTLSTESLEYGLPLIDTYSSSKVRNIRYSTEAASASISDVGKIHEFPNLGVGKLVELQVDIDKKIKEKDEKGFIKETTITKKICIPLQVILETGLISSQTMVRQLSNSDKDITFTERWYDLKSGKISWKDFLFCDDILKEMQKSIILDESGILSKIHTRIANNRAATVFSRVPSLGTVSNIWVFTTSEADRAAASMGYPTFSNPKVVESVMQSKAAQFLVAIDVARERVHIYTRGVPGFSNMSAKDVKKASKEKNDILDIMKAMNSAALPF